MSSNNKYDAILALDPAGKASCGLALRATKGLDVVRRGRLRAPKWYHDGTVWNQSMLDELAVELHECVPRDGRVLLVFAETAYGGHQVARSIGTCIGAVKATLQALNVWEPKDSLPIQDSVWRKSELPALATTLAGIGNKTARRAAGKAAAVAAVFSLYNIDTGDNAAEAILMSDFAVFAHREKWVGK